MPLHSDRTQSLEKGQRTTSRAAAVHACTARSQQNNCSAIHGTHAAQCATHTAQRALTVLPRNPLACLSTAPLSASTCNGDRAFRTTTNPLRSNRNRARSSSAAVHVRPCPSIVPEGTEDAVDIVDSCPARRAHALAARMHFLVSEHAVNPRARNSRAAPPKTPVWLTAAVVGWLAGRSIFFERLLHRRENQLAIKVHARSA